MKILIGALVLLGAIMLFPISDVYSTKISCAEDIDLQKYPICNYVTEWNESQEFDEKVLAELTKKVNEINNNTHDIHIFIQEAIDQVNLDYPGLQEKCQKIQDKIYELLKISR